MAATRQTQGAGAQTGRSFDPGVQDSTLRGLIGQNIGSLAGIQGSLLSAAHGKVARSILVTSSHRREGKTTAAVCIAVALAGRGGANVLLVDGNLTAPKIHEIFGVGAQPGFSEFLAARAGAVEAMRKTGDEHLTIMPHGVTATTVMELYHSASFEKSLASLKEKFDYLVYDGHPVLGDSDVSVIAPLFDGVVLVVECEYTRWEVIQEVKERLVRAGGNVLGVVLNKRRFYIPQAFYGGY
jgi:protein-tyrosine kinase